MSMLYRPLVSPLASRGRPEPPEAPLCEGPAAAADRCLQEVHCDRCRAAPRCRRPQPLLQLDHGDRYCPGPRLERLRSPFRSTCEAGRAASSEKPVAAVGQVGKTHEFVVADELDVDNHRPWWQLGHLHQGEARPTSPLHLPRGRSAPRASDVQFTNHLIRRWSSLSTPEPEHTEWVSVCSSSGCGSSHADASRCQLNWSFGALGAAQRSKLDHAAHPLLDTTY